MTNIFFNILYVELGIYNYFNNNMIECDVTSSINIIRIDFYIIL